MQVKSSFDSSNSSSSRRFFQMQRKRALRDTVEYKEHQGEGEGDERKECKKKGLDSMEFFVPSIYLLKKYRTEKKTSITKKFSFRFQVLFSDRQKESKNHIDTF